MTCSLSILPLKALHKELCIRNSGTQPNRALGHISILSRWLTSVFLTLHSLLFCTWAKLLHGTLYLLQKTFNISLCIFPIPRLITVHFMLFQIISPHTCSEHPVNFWFLSPSVTHMAEMHRFDTLPWTIPSNKISRTPLHTIAGRWLNCIA